MKKIVAIIIVAVLALALIPFDRAYLDDGGTVVYGSALYSATKVHRMVTQPDSGQLKGYEVGWRVEILGMTVYDKTELEPID